MSKLSAKISEEVGKLLPPTIYFFVALHIVAIVRALLLKGAGLPVNSSISIAVAALVLGKAVLLADMLPFINLYPAKPLAYNVAWKTALYFFAALAIHYVEHLIDYWREAGSFAAGNRELLAHIVWPHFWAIQILLTILILAYCTTRELGRALGGDTLRRMFFGPMPKIEVS